MINKILFRGKSIRGNRRDPNTGEFVDIGKWVEGFFVNCASMYDDPEKDRIPEIISYNADRQYTGEYSTLDVYEVDLDTVSQYTGLKDKNGKNIFGGDILELDDRYVEVVYDTGLARWDCRFVDFNGRAIIFPFKGVEPKDFYKYEVVGNRWDNPELLEKKE